MTRRVLRAVIADDEPMARSTLRDLCARDDTVEVVAECADGAQALQAVRTLEPDLLFLDIRMPGVDGLQVLEALPRDRRPALIVTTAYDRFAVRAFEEEAVDYLLKPFDDRRFFQALERARERVARDQGTAAQEAPGYPARLRIHREGRIELVDVDELLWVQAADQYVRLHTDRGEVLMRESMAELERLLDPGRFQRVHRSALVAMDHVVRLESKSRGGRLLLRDGTWVPVSRSRIPLVRKRLG